MSFDWIALIRDLLVIAYLFVLRIGVPLMVTLLGGMWLRKVLEPKPEAARRPAAPAVSEAPRL